MIEVSRQRSFFWNGRRTSLEHQALDPFLNPVEHGLRDIGALLALLSSSSDYAALFKQSFPGDANPVTADRVAKALAAFQHTLTDGESAFDRHVAGQPAALTEPARRGWLLFSGKAGCTRCHLAEGPKPLLTDHAFHTLAFGLGKISRRLPEIARRVSSMHKDGRLQGHSVLADPEIAGLGRFVVTLDPADIAKFKTPSLRNVALTAPYMHDGSVATLADAVELEIYYRSAEDGRPLILTPVDKADLVAFLESLTGWTPKMALAFSRSGSPRR